MSNIYIRGLFFICTLINLMSLLYSFPGLNTDWQTLETDNFIIYFPDGYEWEANQALQNLEYYREDVIKLTGNDLGKISIVIEDKGMYTNAFADSWENKIHIYIYEPDAKSTIGLNENKYRRTTFHEYTHIGHLTNVKGYAKSVKFVIGDSFQPNDISPSWIIEGITVFGESQQSLYEGRVNDGYFGAVIASKAREKKLPSINAATNMIPTYPLGDWYLNGGMFFNYLSNTYGKEKFSELFNKYGSFWWASIVGHIFPWTGLDFAAKRVYGKSMKNLYKEWTDYEEGKYQNWNIDGQRLTNSGWYKGYLNEYMDDIYYFKAFYNNIDVGFTQLVKFDPIEKKEEIIADLKNLISSPIQIFNDQIYYTVSEIDRGYSNVSTWGYTSTLYSVDINTGESKKVCKDDIRAFCILNNGDILYSKDQKHHFGSEIWMVSNGIKQKVADTDQLISELEAGDVGIFVVSKRDFENWNVNRFNLEDITFSSIANSPWAEFDIHLQRDRLIYTANHNRIYSIFSYDLTDKITYKLTNKGFAREGVAIRDSLYFIGLSDKGEDIFVKPLDFIEWESALWVESVTPDFLSLNLSPEKGGYSSNLKDLLVPYTHMFYPNVDGESIGVELWGADALGQNTYSLGLEYSSEENKYYVNTWFVSRIFAPLYLSTYTNYIDYFYGSSSYPIYVTSKPGLSSVWTGLSTTLIEKHYEEEIISPYISVSFGYPLTSFGMNTSLSIRKTSWKKEGQAISKEKLSLNLSNWISHTTRFGYLRLDNKFKYSDTDVLVFRNRGKGELKAPFGVTISPSYSVQLLKIRRGFWNVNMFIEDFNGKFFTDCTVINSKDFLLATGGELSMETKLAFGALRFSPTVGAAINKEGKWNYYWRLNFPLSAI